MKLPIICDFDKFNTAVIPREEVQFLYCGAASYLELVAFIIKAYEHLKGFDRISLKLVLGGNPAQLREVKEVIDASSAKETITLVANVPHDDIPELYASASALLIPLRPTVQDAARFPHKIGEYLASGRPMITTAYGEINHYRFKDGDTALIAEDYHPESFSHKMKFIIENPEQAYKIGLNGRRMGKASFHFPVFARDLKHYFEALNNTEAAIQSIKN